jgi:hypothetical protein
MFFPTILIFLILQINLHGQEINCPTHSVVDFVRESLTTVCFNSDSTGFLNYTMDNVEFYNAHCRVYEDIKQCLETKLKHCDDIKPGFHQHVLSLIENYPLPLEYFDHDTKNDDKDHLLQNLIPFCDGNKLSGKID